MNNINTSRSAISAIQSHTGYWLRSVSNHVSHAFSLRLLATGVTVAEWVVLREMYDNDEMSPSRLAELTGMTRGAASRLLDRLVHKSLVTREGRDDDRRYQDIRLTPAGRRLVPSLAALADQNDLELFAPLTIKERAVLLATLKKLAHAHTLHTIPTE